MDPWLFQNLACPRDFKPLEPGPGPGEVDPFVQEAIAATSGDLYRPLVGKLRRYPIPECPLPDSNGSRLLELGCNWGRWCISAARKGYLPVGLDPNLETVLAARRALAESGRVLKRSGICVIQMPNAWGPHNLLHQLKRGFRQPRGFEVRYWTPGESKTAFRACIGPTSLTVDGYFSLNPRPVDLEMLAPAHRLVVRVSEALRKLSGRWRWLTGFADSLFVYSSATLENKR